LSRREIVKFKAESGEEVLGKEAASSRANGGAQQALQWGIW